MDSREIRSRLTMDEQVRLDDLLAARRRSPRVAGMLAVLGFWGLHRYYTGSVGLGLIYMLTFGLLAIGWIRDLFRIGALVEACNARLEVRLGELIILERSATISAPRDGG